MTTSQILAVVFIFICVYLIVDRICRCLEMCSVAKSYAKAVDLKLAENTSVDWVKGFMQYYREMNKNGASRIKEDYESKGKSKNSNL